MGNDLRRVYIYGRRPEDDDEFANRFWPPGNTAAPASSDDQSPSASSDYPDGYFAQGGGLLGMMLRAVQQGLVQPSVNSGSTPNSGDGYGSPPGGLLGRLLALHAEQSGLQPVAVNDEPTPTEPRDPNFREVSRARVAVRQDPRGSYQPVSKESQNIGGSPLAPAGAFPRSLVRAAPQANDGLLEAYGQRPALPRINNSPTMKTAQVPMPGIGLPLPPMPPGAPPQVPLPAIPEWWKAAGPILRGVFSFKGVGGGGSDNYRRCMRAAAGNTDQWEDFCRNLQAGRSKTSGGETQNRACWSKNYESKTNKQLWCRNQFGGE